MARPPANGRGGAAAVAVPGPIASEATSPLLATLLSVQSDKILGAWVTAQLASLAPEGRPASEAGVRAEAFAILEALQAIVAGEATGDWTGPAAAELTRLLHKMSAERVRQGYSPSSTARAVFTLRSVLLAGLEEACAGDAEALVRETRAMNAVIDSLGLQTFEGYVVARERVITSQQESMLELSTPVVKLWDGIVAVPLIGTLDSNRTQLVMESLLQTIVETGSQVAIIDITGVSVVDTLVAQHLLKTVAATRLMGAECMISGIRPQIAQTMVHLGVELSEIITKATLADAFRAALRILQAAPAAPTPGH